MSIEQPHFGRRESDREKPATDPSEEPVLPLPELQDGNMENYIHAHSVELGFEGAREKIIEILRIVKEDEKAVELITATLESIFRYVESIYKMEIQTKLLSLRWEGQELAEKIQTHDTRRRHAHNALIANLISCTRYLNEHFFSENPSTGIYNGEPQHLIEQNRHAIADWAIEVEHEILLNRSR